MRAGGADTLRGRQTRARFGELVWLNDSGTDRQGVTLDVVAHFVSAGKAERLVRERSQLIVIS